MGGRFFDAGLHTRFLKRVLAPGLASVLCWWVGEEVLPRPTSWDLLFYLIGGILGVWAFFEGLAWLTKTLAIVVFKQPYERVHKPDSTRTTKSEPGPFDWENRSHDFAEKERDLYRTIDLKICRGEPPARAFCRDPEVEFELLWNDDGLTVCFQSESLRGEAYKADGAPGESELKLDCEGEIIAADSLRAMTLGARSLRLESAGPDCFEARLRTSLSAGHGEVDIWVELRIDLGSRSVRYVCYQRFNDCR